MTALLGMPFDRRVAHPCIGRDRADLVLPGCAIFEAIRREWPTERVRVADRGLREGILISLIDADRGERVGTAASCLTRPPEKAPAAAAIATSRSG